MERHDRELALEKDIGAMNRILLALLLLTSGFAQAQTPGEERKPLRLDVDGEIAIDQQGVVYQHNLSTILAPDVKKLVDAAISKWRFEPVLRNGKPVAAKSDMYLTLTARPADGGYRLSIERVRFHSSRQATHKIAPAYPLDALRAGVGADLLVALRVDREGSVLDVAVVQGELVSKRKRVNPAMLKSFEKAAKDAYRKWKYEPGDGDAASDTTLLTMMSFSTGDSDRVLGGWKPLDKTQPNPIPWLPAAQQAFDAEGLRQGQSIALDGGVKLQTPVAGTSL
ncbi:energy transducer TonB [Lysobacter sp. CFH 32150]|nr:energy transducer TonB [Lysobacter sp. CFH 32150]